MTLLLDNLCERPKGFIAFKQTSFDDAVDFLGGTQKVGQLLTGVQEEGPTVRVKQCRIPHHTDQDQFLTGSKQLIKLLGQPFCGSIGIHDRKDR